MSDLKTKPTKASVKKFIEAAASEQKRADSFVLLKLFEKITGEKAVIWGTSIIGFGSYHYKYASGQEGDWPITGFSPRKANLSIYIMPGFKKSGALLKKLGKQKHSVSCLYINKLEDVDMKVLEKLITDGVKYMRKHGQPC